MTFGVIIGAVFISALASVLLLFTFSRFAARLGLVDHPDWRKVQKRPTPLVGGPAICLAVTVTLLLTMPFIDGGVGSLSAYTGLAQGGLLIVLLGMLDDIKPIRHVTNWRFSVWLVARRSLSMAIWWEISG